MKANNILDTIGNTPHVRINRLVDPAIEVWIKMVPITLIEGTGLRDIPIK